MMLVVRILGVLRSCLHVGAQLLQRFARLRRLLDTLSRFARCGAKHCVAGRVRPRVLRHGKHGNQRGIQLRKLSFGFRILDRTFRPSAIFLKVMKNAGSKHAEGIEQINKAIKDLEKARDALMMSDRHLLTAENKIDDLTVKRLTKNAPSVAERLKDQEK